MTHPPDVPTPPDLRDLLPDDVGAEELARLERVHELLGTAGPPAELPPHLALAPMTGGGRVIAFARGRWKAVALVAAAAAAALFGIGFLSGYSAKDDGFKATYGPVPMVGAGETRNANAEIWVGPKDEALNWPSKLTVRGLPALPQDAYYALYLTDAKTGKRLLLCSAFAVHAGITTVTFNFPGPVKGRGWMIVAETGAGKPGNDKPMLWTTRSGSRGTA